MKCDCCARRKRLFEAFEPISHKEKTINLCVDCCTLVYKIRDAQKYGNISEKDTLIQKVREKKFSQEFVVWFEEQYGLKKPEHL